MSTENLSIAEMGRQLRSGAVSSETLTRDALARIRDRDPRLHAFIRVTEQRALDDARKADADLKAGRDRGPMHGVPYALKDIYDTAGIATTCHSKLRQDHVPSEDLVVAARFAEGGACCWASWRRRVRHRRSELRPALASGAQSVEPGAYHRRIVFRHRRRHRGGILRMATGSDTGGSIRGPAAWCGTAGIKPTYGRVSRRGVLPLSWSLDHTGPLGRSVEDCAIALQVIAGHDPQDPASADEPVPDFLAGLEIGVNGLRIGVPRAFFASAPLLEQPVLEGIDAAIAKLREAGATVEDVTLPDYALFGIAGRVIMLAEAFAIHQADLRSGWLITHRRPPAGFFLLGAALTAADYVEALRVRGELAAAVNGVLGRYDALLTACALTTAPRFDAVPDSLASTSPMQTIPFNVTGHPAMSIPVGRSRSSAAVGADRGPAVR